MAHVRNVAMSSSANVMPVESVAATAMAVSLFSKDLVIMIIADYVVKTR